MTRGGLLLGAGCRIERHELCNPNDLDDYGCTCDCHDAQDDDL